MEAGSPAGLSCGPAEKKSSKNRIRRNEPSPASDSLRKTAELVWPDRIPSSAHPMKTESLLARAVAAAAFASAAVLLCPCGAEESLETRKELAAKVIPLLEERCASCHSAEADRIRGGFGVVTDIPKLRESGMIDFESPQHSLLYTEILEERMPELTREERAAGKTEPDFYSHEEVAYLLAWIRAGAPDLDGSLGEDEAAPEPSLTQASDPAPEAVPPSQPAPEQAATAEQAPAPAPEQAATAEQAPAPAPEQAATAVQAPAATPEPALIPAGAATSLPPTPTLGIAAARPVVTEAAAKAAAVEDLLAQAEDRRPRIRYLSLLPLHNDSLVPEERLELMRQGVAKLLNSLSSNPRVATFPRVGPEGVFHRVDLDDIGWSSELWDEVASFYPYALDDGGSRALGAVTGAAVSVMRADWLAANATRGQLYNRILDLPADLKGLEAKLQVDIAKNLREGRAPRAGFTESGVSRANRLVERHEIGAYEGMLWLSYDFAKSSDRGSIHDFPLGPEFAGLAGGDKVFKEDGGELIWTLPNGFLAYLIIDTLYNRLDGPAPTDIVADREAVTGRSEVVNAISCMICHQHGMRDVPADEIRPLAGAATFSAEEKRLIEALYVPVEEMNALIAADRQAFQAALAKAGVGTAGREPIRMLVEAYEAPVKLSRAAAELGMEIADLEAALKNSGATLEIYTRLATGGFPRDAFEKNRFPELALRLDLGTVVSSEALRLVGKKPSDEAREGDAAAPIVPVLTAPKAVFADGDVMELTVVSPVDGHVQIIYQNAEGENLLLFPNSLQLDDRIFASKPLVLSGAEAPIEVVVEAPFGKETVVAIVSDRPFANAEEVKRAIREASDQGRVLVEFDDDRLEVNVTKSVRLRAKGSRVGSARLQLETRAE